MTSATSAATRAAVGSPREAHATRLKGEVCDAHLMPDADVDTLAKEVVDWYVEWNPIFATYIGIHGHDHLMPKGRIRTPIKIWSEISLEAATRLPGFLQVIEATGKENLAGPDRGRLEESVAKTGEAIRAYGKWIESDVLPRSKDRVGIGGAKFRKLVRLRELGLPGAEH